MPTQKSDREIADAMVRLVQRQDDFKRNLTEHQAIGALDPFRRAVIRKTYRSLITQAIEGQAE